MLNAISDNKPINLPSNNWKLHAEDAVDRCEYSHIIYWRQHGAPWSELKGSNGDTPLAHAVQDGDSAINALLGLLEREAPLSEPQMLNGAPFYMISHSVEHLQLKVLKALLDFGANADNLNGLGITPIALAIRSIENREDDAIEALHLLLEAGATPNPANYANAEGKSFPNPLADIHARELNPRAWLRAIETLIRAGSNPIRGFHQADQGIAFAQSLETSLQNAGSRDCAERVFQTIIQHQSQTSKTPSKIQFHVGLDHHKKSDRVKGWRDRPASSRKT